MLYGDPPEDLGPIDLSPVEMMFWMYCPVLTPTSLLTIPANLQQFAPIVRAALEREGDAIDEKYVYLTAKTLWVSGDNIGNRPGWHSDGFGSDDVNYIWYDRAPTEFITGAFSIPDDCTDAMKRMSEIASISGIVRYPGKRLLRLTPAVVHRSPERFEAGMRTFVKVSISANRYDLAGNSINHELAERWPLVARKLERNHPSSAKPAERD